MDYLSYYSSPLGTLTIASDGHSITGLWMEGQRHFGRTLSADTHPGDARPEILTTKYYLDQYFAGKSEPVTRISLAPGGTEFQKLIWNLLLQIPYGKTFTYAELASLAAAHMGKTSMSAQAVGNAVGRNPISILIPCHRVIGAGGSTTGYSGGLDRKQFLLQLESSGKQAK